MILCKFRKRLPRAFRLILLACTSLLIAAPAPAQSSERDQKGRPAHSHSWEKGRKPKKDPGTAPVPEPGTWAAMASLAAVAFAMAYRKRKDTAAV